MAVCKWLVGLKPNLVARSWWVYKSAMVHFMKQYGPLEAVEYLNQHAKATGCRSLKSFVKGGKRHYPVRKTSSKKEKRISPSDLSQIMKALNVNLRYDSLLGYWLMSGIVTGLRPSEWRTAVLDGDYLVVENGKFNESRACGRVRRLYIGGVGDQFKWMIEELIKGIALIGYDECYTGCRQRLYEIGKTLWPHREKRPTLYSARHQFSANAKSSGADLVSIAALMGHRSDRTATSHYGRSKHGDGTLIVEPSEENKALVKRSPHTNKAKQTTGGSVTDPDEGK